MFKRATWFSVGLVAGAGVSKWAERKARRRLARYLPSAQVEAGRQAAGRAREAAADRVADLRRAVEDGRDAMAAREEALRRQLRLAPGEPARPRLLAAEEGRGGRPGPPAGPSSWGPGPGRRLSN
jgi:hypothetical protein